MALWKLYTTRAKADSTRVSAHSIGTNPTVLAIPFNHDDQPLDQVTEVATSNSWRPVVVSTAAFLAFIDEARSTGLTLFDLKFSRPLTVDDAGEVSEAIDQLRQGASLEILRAVLMDLLTRRGVIVNKASFWVEPSVARSRGRLDIQNNGILSSTLGEETFEAVDVPLSAVGQLAACGG